MAYDPIFSPSFGNRPSYLVGRNDIIDGFLAGLASAPGNRERALMLLGQRGSGKTVLLWELGDRAAEAGFVVASPTVISQNMLERIVEKLQDQGEQYLRHKQHAAHLSGANVGAFGFSAGLQFDRETREATSPQHRLTQITRELTNQGAGVLILVDELQASSPETRDLVSTYQELVGERLNVAMVMAGLPGAVSATLNDRVLTFLNRARKVRLEPLRFGDVDGFFERSFDQMGLLVEAEMRQMAARATQGSPYLMQLVGHNLVSRVPAGGAIDASILDQALQASREDFENDVCRTTLAALSERDGDFLAAMAQDSGPSKTAEIAQRMGVTVDYAQKYRKRLIDAGVIVAARRGEVAFDVPFMADYLRGVSDDE